MDPALKAYGYHIQLCSLCTAQYIQWGMKSSEVHSLCFLALG